MKKTVLMLAGAVVMTATAAFAQLNPSWTAPSEPFRIADNLYYVGSEGLTSLLITGKQGHILIDAPMEQNVDLIEGNIRKLGFKVEDIKVLLVSHAHFDHAAGLARIKKDSGAILAASAGDKSQLEKGNYVGAEEVAALKFAPVKVDKVLKDGESVNLGGASLVANLTPGHSPGCTTWTFNVKVDGVSRKVLYYCSTSVALNKLGPKEQYKGIVADYRSTFTKLGKMKADIFIAPHAEQFDLGAKRAKLKAGTPNPFVDPTELQKTVAASKAAFDKACAEQGCK